MARVKHRVTPTMSDGEATLLMEQGYPNFDGTPNTDTYEAHDEFGLDIPIDEDYDA